MCYSQNVDWKSTLRAVDINADDDLAPFLLTHWGQVTHICVSKLTIIGSDNGLVPGRRQASIWANDGILLIGTLLRNKFQWNFNRNSYIFIQENEFENVICEMAAILSRPQCVNLEWLHP